MDTPREVVSFRLSRVSLLLALCCLVCLSAVSTRADGTTFLSPGWDVSGALLMVGNDVCSGLPCTETISFSFDVGYVSVLPGFWEPYIVNLVANWTGDMGSFTEISAGPQIRNSITNYFAFFNDGTEIDIHPIPPIVIPPLNTLNWVPTDPPVFDGVELFSCGTTTCVTDFVVPPLGQGQTPPVVGIRQEEFGVFSVTPIAAPEPSMLSMLAFGLLALGLAAASKKIPHQWFAPV
jgi:hypothetical protein